MKPLFPFLLALIAIACGQGPAPGDPGGGSNDPLADQPGLFGIGAHDFALDAPEAPGRRIAVQLGIPVTAFTSALAVAGDFDGDGFDSIGVYDPRRHSFALRNRNADGPADVELVFGASAGVPLVGDWDGDGVDTVGMWTAGTFSLRNSNTTGAAEMTFAFGPTSGFPLVGDWDGDGRDSVGVYDPGSQEVLLRNALSEGPPDRIQPLTLAPLSIPIAGDWNADGRDTISVYDGVAHLFHVRDGDDATDTFTLARGTDALVWMPLGGRWDTRELIPQSSGYAWTTATPASVGLDRDALEEARSLARSSPAMNALLVVRHGQLVSEDYFRGFRPELAGNIKSASKSLLSALVGLAGADGAVPAGSTPVSSVLPELFVSVSDARANDVTLTHLLTMRAGFVWDENVSSLGEMIASDRWGEHVTHLAMNADPGAAWSYSSGLTHLFSLLLTQTSGVRTSTYARQTLLEPLGIAARRWDRDPLGNDFGGAEVYMTARDLARFGELYLRNGTLGGVAVPEAWVTSSTQPISDAGAPYTYGAWWWQRTVAGRATFFAWGYGGQFVVVVPSLDTVVVATQNWQVDGAGAADAEARFFELLSVLLGGLTL